MSYFLKNIEFTTNQSKAFVRLIYLVAFLILFSGCNISKGKIDITLYNLKTKNLNISVTNVQVLNHQFIITGTGLNDVTTFKIKNGASSTDLQIESQSNTSIVANTISDVSLAVGIIFDFVLSNASAASTFQVTFINTNNSITAAMLTSMGATKGQIMKYNGTSWVASSITNAQTYLGTWDATTNNPDLTLPSSIPGDYFIVSVSGTFNLVSYTVGDWIISDGYNWQKVANSAVVVSTFNGRRGIVTLVPGDYVTLKNGSGKIPGSSLNDLADLDIVTPINGSVLKYDTSTSKWIVGVDNAGSGVYTGAFSKAVATDGAGALTTSTTTAAELNFVSGVTSSIQTQLGTKLGTALADGKIFVGNGSGVATAVLLSGDATLINTGAITIATSAVNTAKILDGTILPADLDFSGSNIGTSGLVIRNLTGGFSPLVCSTVGYVPTWTVTGFICQATVSGTTGKIAKFTSGTAVGDSIMSESGTTVTLSGVLALPTTTSTAGQITINGNQFAHSYRGVFLGNMAGSFTSTGSSNIGIGDYVLRNITSGSSNTAVGSFAGWQTDTGNNNTYIGSSAGSQNMAGTRNTYIGSGAGGIRGTGASNTYLGTNVGQLWTGDNNTLVGDSSGGSGAGFGGSSSSFLGYQSGFSVSGSKNVLLGYQSGYNLTTGSNNVIIGGNDGSSIATSSNNIILSDGAGNERIRVNSSGNVGIGTPSPGYKLQVGAAADGSEARANAWNILSDERLKRDFEIIPNSLEKILTLNGYYYFWNRGTDTSKKMGVMAQEVEKVFPEVVSLGADGFLSVSYNHLVAGVIEAFKEFYHKWQWDSEAIHKELALKNKEIIFLKSENVMMKAYLCSKDRKAAFCASRNSKS